MRARSVLLMLVLSLAGCGARSTLDEHGGSRATVEDDAGPPVRLTRVHGIVTLREGECMPPSSPDRCFNGPVRARVAAFEPIRLVETPRGGVDYPDPERVSRVVAETASAEDGAYELALPAGRYTLIAQYRGTWDPRSWSSVDDGWAVIEVPAEGELERRLRIHRALE